MNPGLFALLLLPVSAAQDTVRVQNTAIRLGFDAGNGALVEMIDRASRQNFVAEASPLWQLDRYDHSARSIFPADAGRFSWRKLRPPRRGIELTWSDFKIPDARAFRVVATVSLQGDSALSDWRIVLEGLGGLQVEQIRFPRVENIPALANEELVIPRWMGALARSPRSVLYDTAGAPRRLQLDYPGAMSLQMLALYSRDGPGFYAATDDTLAYRKSFALWGMPEGRRGFELIHQVDDPQISRPTWSPRYAVVLGSFRGDWMSAAERYRAWGTRQRWARESRLRRGLVPKWLIDTGMWVWNRGRSQAVLPHALALQNKLELPVSVFWHWWHHGPYDTSFPDYLPPREGAESFSGAVADADRAGIHAMVYMNQRLWCTGQPSWGPRAAAAAVKERDGKIRTEVYNIFDPKPCATMDVTQPYWRDTYAAIADTVLDQYGVHGIYMDQAVLSLVCWDPSHGHPLGGGNYWMGGFRKLAAQIRRDAQPGKRILLAGEGAGEAWLPELDLMLTLQVSQERYSAPGSGWEPIPLFQAVYHAYGLTYGSYSSLVLPPYDELWPAATAPADTLSLFDTRFSRQFYLEQARSFAWGLQPTIANFRAAQLVDRPREMAYMMELARLRARASDYLLYGTFLRPPALKLPQVKVDLSRVSIYAARRGGPTVSQADNPSAVVGAWRSPGGNVALVMASIVDEPATVEISIDPAVYGLKVSGKYVLIDAETSRAVGEWQGKKSPVRVEMPARGARILELRAIR